MATWLVIFDADGTLTPQRDTANGPAILELLPGVEEQCAWLRQQGYTLAIASNQSGRRSRRDIAAQLRWTANQIGATTIRWSTRPQRRKPQPAMLVEIMRELDAVPDNTIFVGDRDTDEQAAQAAGVTYWHPAKFFGWSK